MIKLKHSLVVNIRADHSEKQNELNYVEVEHFINKPVPIRLINQRWN